MLDFLPERTREILLSYPFIKEIVEAKLKKRQFLKRIREFLSIKSKKGTFLRALQSFKSDPSFKEVKDQEIKVLTSWLFQDGYEEIDAMIDLLPPRERQIALWLKKGNGGIDQSNAINSLVRLGSNETIPLLEEIAKNDHSTIVRCDAIRALGELASKSSIPLIEGITKSDPDEYVRQWARRILAVLSTKLEHHILYSAQQPEFFIPGKAGALGEIKKRNFEKEGSGLVLLGGKLAGKVIIRIVSENAFFAWKKAFESEDAWRKAGFNYVPVEPIMRDAFGKLRAYPFRYEEKTNPSWWPSESKWWSSEAKYRRKLIPGEIFYRVYAQVLGSSLLVFLKNPNNQSFRPHLEGVRDLIISVLEKLQISHRHLHDNNFCIEMRGGIPRLYVIDFDASISP